MKEMQTLALELEQMMGNFKNEITNMKIISEDAYDLVGEAASRLKKLELRVRNFNLDKLTTRYVRDISDGFELIDKLSRAISSSPIQIKIVDELKMKLDALLSKIDVRVKRDVAYGEYCEKLIMYANNYRASFSDVESSVSKAEMLFFEARFEEAVDLVGGSLNKLGDLPIKRPNFEGTTP
jgi:septation ring formation regulator EzrA